jgi:hypothetical protein
MPVAGFGDLTVHELWNLGQWAKQLTHATRELGAAASLALATSTTGWTVAAWWRRDLLYVVACRDRRSVSEVLAVLGDLP